MTASNKKTIETAGGGVFAFVRRWDCEPKKAPKHRRCQRITGTTGKKFLQTGGTGRESRKRPRPVVGKKPNGKCQLLIAINQYN
jgi:hypothetical protein